MKISEIRRMYQDQIDDLQRSVDELRNDRMLLRAMMAAHLVDQEVISDMLEEIEKNPKPTNIPPLWDED
ncbi:MAG: hypothetical protein ACOYM3_20610 [Terrimicrobiaceae bacterium]